jgi:hypothetical protein
MYKFLLVGLVGLSIYGCGATSNIATEEVVGNKDVISDCMRENYKEKESCVTKQTIANVGLVCKNVTVTGSRLPLRKCTTAAQREEKKLNAKLDVDRIQRGLKTRNTGETQRHNGF